MKSCAEHGELKGCGFCLKNLPSLPATGSQPVLSSWLHTFLELSARSHAWVLGWMGLNAVLILALSLLTGRRVKVSAQEINVQQTQPPAGEALDIRFVASVDAFANRHHEKTLLRKNEDSSKVQKVELRSIHSLLASFTTRGFTRHKRSDPVGETTGMSANYIPNNDFLPWTKNQMFKNMVTTASQEKNGVAVSFSPAANTVKPAWSRSAHYAQVYDYCVSLTTNRYTSVFVRQPSTLMPFWRIFFYKY